MADKLSDLRALSDLTATVLAARQAAMKSILIREDALRRQIADLAAALATRSAELQEEPDAALLAGADMRWQIWIEEKRADLNAALARVLAEKEAHRAGLAKAFGRNRAAGDLVIAAKAAGALALQRKADNAI